MTAPLVGPSTRQPFRAAVCRSSRPLFPRCLSSRWWKLQSSRPSPMRWWSASTPPHQSVGLDDLARGGRPTDARFGGTSQRPQVQIPLGSRARQAMAHRVGPAAYLLRRDDDCVVVGPCTAAVAVSPPGGRAGSIGVHKCRRWTNFLPLVAPMLPWILGRLELRRTLRFSAKKKWWSSLLSDIGSQI